MEFLIQSQAQKAQEAAFDFINKILSEMGISPATIQPPNSLVKACFEDRELYYEYFLHRQNEEPLFLCSEQIKVEFNSKDNSLCLVQHLSEEKLIYVKPRYQNKD
jgi:succinyl-CoA synthetase beta subunit